MKENKSENNLTTKDDRFVKILEGEANKLMNNLGLELKPEIKKSIFNIVVACNKTIAEKGINWDNVNQNGLASKMLDYALLELNPANNELYIIPYENKTLRKFDLNFEESYRGKRKKAKKFSIDGLIDMPAFLVREGDTYEPEYNLTDGDKVIFKPKAFSSGKIIGGFCYLKFENPVKNRIVEMSLEELEKVKNASRLKMGGKTSPAWAVWESEMFKKAIIKRAAKEIEIDVPVELQEAFINSEKRDDIYDAEYEEKPEPKIIDVNIAEEPKIEINQTTGEVHQENMTDVKSVEMPAFE